MCVFVCVCVVCVCVCVCVCVSLRKIVGGGGGMQMTEAVTPSRGCLALKRKETWCVTSTETTRLIRDGEKGGGG